MNFVGHFPKMFLNGMYLPLRLAQSASSFISGISSTYISVFLVGDMQTLDPSCLIIMGFYHSAAMELADRNFFRTLLILPIASGGGQPERRCKQLRMFCRGLSDEIAHLQCEQCLGINTSSVLVTGSICFGPWITCLWRKNKMDGIIQIPLYVLLRKIQTFK